jgi:hypothetical protein
VAVPTGLEPVTSSLGNLRSIQLNYGTESTKIGRGRGVLRGGSMPVCNWCSCPLHASFAAMNSTRLPNGSRNSNRSYPGIGIESSDAMPAFWSRSLQPLRSSTA